MSTGPTLCGSAAATQNRHPRQFVRRWSRPTSTANYPARTQAIAIGSSIVVPDPQRLTVLERFSMLVYIWPTRLGTERQALMGTWQETLGAGYGLEIDSRGHLSLRIGNREGQHVVSLPTPLVERRWQLVGASFDSDTAQALLFCRPQPDKQFPVLEASEHRFTVDVSPATDTSEFRLAAWPGERSGNRVLTQCHFDGKLDRPRLANQPLGPDELEQLAQLNFTWPTSLDPGRRVGFLIGYQLRSGD